MDLSQKTLRRGFTLLEVMMVSVISLALMLLLASTFRLGYWEMQRSSGRIEVVRRGRTTIDNIQRYLASACRPGYRQAPGGTGTVQAEAVFGPENIQDDLHSTPEDHVYFWSADDHLSGALPRGARELQEDPLYYAFAISPVPGEDNKGQDLLLRRFVVPAEPLIPQEWDLSAKPRYLGRRLGLPDGQGGYQDAFVVRRIREGALQIQVNVSSDLITDDEQRNRIENSAPIRLKMSSIYQLPSHHIQ